MSVRKSVLNAETIGRLAILSSSAVSTIQAYTPPGLKGGKAKKGGNSRNANSKCSIIFLGFPLFPPAFGHGTVLFRMKNGIVLAGAVA